MRPGDPAARPPQGPSGALPRPHPPVEFTWCPQWESCAAPLLGRSRRKRLWWNLPESLEMSGRSSEVGQEQAGSGIPGLGELPTHLERLGSSVPSPRKTWGSPEIWTHWIWSDLLSVRPRLRHEASAIPPPVWPKLAGMLKREMLTDTASLVGRNGSNDKDLSPQLPFPPASFPTSHTFSYPPPDFGTVMMPS